MWRLGNDAKTKIGAGLVALLMIIAGFLGVFPLIQKTEANPATYIYTEDFEDDTLGDAVTGSNPDEAWYDYNESSGTIFSISDAVAKSLNNSFLVNDATGSCATADFILSKDGGSAIEYLDYWFYADAGHQQLINTIWLNDTVILFAIRIGDAANADNVSITYYTGTGYSDTGWDFTIGAWYEINMTFNWTTEKVRLGYYNGTWNYMWVNFSNSGNVVSKWRWATGATAAKIYLDDVTLGTNDSLGIIMDITVTGYDANKVLWGNPVNVTNTSSNTSIAQYLVVENTGTANISNLTIHLEMFSFGGTIEVYSNRSGTWQLEGSLSTSGNITIISGATPPNGLEVGEKWWFYFKITVPAGTSSGTYYTGGTSTPDCYITVS